MASSDENDIVEIKDKSTAPKPEKNRKNFKDRFGIIKCTICSEQVNPFVGNSMKSHELLNVVICKSCDKFLKSGDWTLDEDGKYEQCLWCGQGGEIINCDNCERSLCKSCVKRNAGRDYFLKLQKILEQNQDWRCFFCDDSPIADKKRKNAEIIAYVNNVRTFADAPTKNRKRSSLAKVVLHSTRFSQEVASSSSSSSSLGCVSLLRVVNSLLTVTDTCRVTIMSIKDALDADHFRPNVKEQQAAAKNLKEVISQLVQGLGDVSNLLEKCEHEVGSSENKNEPQDVAGSKQKARKSIKVKRDDLSDAGRIQDVPKMVKRKSETKHVKNSDVNSKNVKLARHSISVEDLPSEAGTSKVKESCEEEIQSVDDEVLFLKVLDLTMSSNVANKAEVENIEVNKIAETLGKAKAENLPQEKEENLPRENKDSKEENARDAVFQLLDMNSDEEVESGDQTSVDDKNSKPGTSEETSKVVKLKISKNPTEQRKDFVPDSNPSSEINTEDEMDDLMGASPPRKRNKKASLEKTVDRLSKNKKNLAKNEGFDPEFERRLKSARKISSDDDGDMASSDSERKKSFKEKVLKKKSHSTKGDDDDEEEEYLKELEKILNVNEQETTTDCSKKQEAASSSANGVDSNRADDENDERAICLAALEEANADLSSDEEDVPVLDKKNATKRKKLAADDLVELPEVGDGEKKTNGVAKSKPSDDSVEKLLNAKITLKRSNDDGDWESVKPKRPIRSTSKKAAILSSDEEEKGSDDDEEEINEEAAEPDDDDDGSASISEQSDSDKGAGDGLDDDDDDFVDQPSTSRGLRKGRKAHTKKSSRKRVNLSSDEEEGDDDLNTSQSKGGRKNIKKIVATKGLAKETVDAYEAEKDRRKRIAENQKLYNEVVFEVDDTSDEAASVKYKKLVLEKDPQTNEAIVEVHPKIVERLKPHQIDGVQFLFENTVESVKKAAQPGHGCVLAHCMGLGKTLQVVTYLHTVLSNEKLKLRTALVIAPLNVVLNWKNEFSLWLDSNDLGLDVFEMSAVKHNADRMYLCNSWMKDGGVLIISYSLYQKLAAGKGIKKEKWRESFARAFLDPGPDIVVCDEGHILKNEKTGISKVITQIRTQRRICLTGTPLQNNLYEYYTMVQFVKPNLLGSKAEFMNRFANPIKNGQYEDSTPQDVSLMKRRAHILHKMLDGCINRQDYTALARALPPKKEYVLTVNMSEKQIELYGMYLREVVGNTDINSLKMRRQLFADYQVFHRIWTHPYGLILHHREMERKDLLKEDDNFIDDEETPSSSSEEDQPEKKKKKGAKNDDDDDDVVPVEKEDSEIEIIRTYSTRRKPDANEDLDSRCPTPIEAQGWFKDAVTEEDKFKVEIAGKFILLFEILRKCESIGDKVLVFSQSLIALDMIEIILEKFDKDGWTCGIDSLASLYNWRWTPGKDYFRLDGSTSADKRKLFGKHFNDPKNLRARLFLISTRAGSLGMNLFGANRVIVFDASWNPTHDVQSMFRVYRFGQTKPVYIYRFISQGTMEETIYERGVTKQSLACRVVDEQQVDRHFSDRDLQALYEFTPGEMRAGRKKETLGVPKDRLLADLLFEKKDWIFTYHEHDSLLQNHEEEQLTEAERQAAWDEYEHERKNPHVRIMNRMPVPGPMNGPPQANFMSNDILAIYVQAMPVLAYLINQCNALIRQSGEAVAANVEDIVRNWITTDPAVSANPAELVSKLQNLFHQLNLCAAQKQTANAQSANKNGGSIFPSWKGPRR